ncbi:hypothetical protein NDU88_003726 [Pleurodeles waltl]|uniref:Uncharacterized protein n=1 Tax=Pleurodeles waltl TaxID=8319 RepID=A0AAV7SGR2_PLEWA|nr:hypothetical protein NDU88_003726 [Pleurodeles waltl]
MALLALPYISNECPTDCGSTGHFYAQGNTSQAARMAVNDGDYSYPGNVSPWLTRLSSAAAMSVPLTAGLQHPFLCEATPVRQLGIAGNDGYGSSPSGVSARLSQLSPAAVMRGPLTAGLRRAFMREATPGKHPGMAGPLHECSGKKSTLRHRAKRAHEAGAPGPEKVRRSDAAGAVGRERLLHEIVTARNRRSRALSGPTPRKHGEAQGDGAPGQEEERRIAAMGVVGHGRIPHEIAITGRRETAGATGPDSAEARRGPHRRNTQPSRGEEDRHGGSGGLRRSPL